MLDSWLSLSCILDVCLVVDHLWCFYLFEPVFGSLVVGSYVFSYYCKNYDDLLWGVAKVYAIATTDAGDATEV